MELNANKELNTVVNGKMTNISNSDERTSVTVAYPIEIKATLSITTDVLAKYEIVTTEAVGKKNITWYFIQLSKRYFSLF